MKASRIAIGGRHRTVIRRRARIRATRRPTRPRAAWPVATLVVLVAMLAGPSTPAQAATCTVTAKSLAQVQFAVGGLPAGSTVCLANGSYGRLTLSASKPGGGINIRPVTPGGATLAGASLDGSYLILSQFRITGDEVTVRPGSTGITVNHNRISGGYFGVNAGPTTSTSINDVTIVGNQFVGPFGEDAIRANRYHDSGDADSAGMFVAGNEFTNIRENGNHSDCFQSVWGGDHLYFVYNYLHDNRCQGFFVKDQPSTIDTVVAENNLMLRNAAPCAPPQTSCGQPAVFQLFGPIANLVVRYNTVWTVDGGSPLTLRNSGWGGVVFQNNVVYRAYSDTSSPFASYFASGNVGCSWEGTWPSSGYTRVCPPKFVNPFAGDWRVPGFAGVTWKLADQHFGP